MRVLIVAKTRMGSGACIGGITETGQSVRLVPFGADSHDGANMEYNVGDIWEIEGIPETPLRPPHTENFVVHEKSLLRRTERLQDMAVAIELMMPPIIGDPLQLYEGLLQATSEGGLYIPAGPNVPNYSTQFWRPDRPLRLDRTTGRKLRYRYPTEDGGYTFTFVGFQHWLEEIPAGTLLRISLAHAWRPDSNVEHRHYAQLSGWILDTEETEAVEPIQHPPLQTDTPSIEILRTVFGHEEFRPFQAEIIECIRRGEDALAVLPTGGGKSLCYQLPALTFDGVTVVVSPLISLMQDQVRHLQNRGICAAFLNSTLPYPDRRSTMQRVRDGAVKLLYLAPETLVRPEIRAMLEATDVACFAIDEAHCISEWGHDFRTDYRQLVSIRAEFRDAVCIALTATATPRVREDIKTLLNLDSGNEFVSSFDRPNLFIAIEPKVDLLAQTLAFLRRHEGESGIIYCQTIRQVESLCRKLEDRGISALPYHADLDNNTRQHNQEAFIRGDTQIIVATIAFGMGIDKPDVRFILHADLPKSPESYYQEIGRAGRDGEPAECLLLFSYGDIDTLNHFIEHGAPSERETRLERLQTLISGTTSTECRRKLILAYFGETYTAQNCGTCDNCRAAETEQVDLTLPAQKFLSCVYRTGEIFGETYIIDVLRGSNQRRIRENRHDTLSTYGIGREYDKGQWRYLTHQFLQQGLLHRDIQHGTLKITDKGNGVLRRDEQFWGLPVPTRDREPSTDESEDRLDPEEQANYDPGLFERLCTKRKELAEAEDVPLYCIFSNRTLAEMTTALPTDRESLLQIHGVGPVKVERYADHFLPIIRAYCEENRENHSAAVESTRDSHASYEIVPSLLPSEFDEEFIEDNRSDDGNPAPLPETHHTLFERLRTERDRIAAAEGGPAEWVFQDDTLTEMARQLPRNRTAFLQIPDVTVRKMERYADHFLPIICAYCAEQGID